MHASRSDILVRGTGPTLLLAHGAGGGVVENFGLVLDDLARDHTVVGPHLPGAGGRPRSSGPLDLDTVADELVAAADGPVTILGESLGSAVAIRAAVRHPDRVTDLVLTAGFAVADPVLDLTFELVQNLDGQPALRSAMLLAACLTESELSAMTPADLAAAAAGADGPPGLPDHVDLVRRVDVRADLAAVRARTLVVVPTGDRLVLPSSGRALADGIRGAELVELPGAGHVLGAADRATWLGHVRAFLAAASGRVAA
jgi:pimeloyl-ACP methyl ester carboxylesterase